MRRSLRSDETDLWARVTATVRPAPGRHAPPPPDKPNPPAPPTPPQARGSMARTVKPEHRLAFAPPTGVEPGRLRRLTREREALGPRLDLHGKNQDEARAALTAFLGRAQDDGWRAVLVITGKGARGDGVLRRMTPEWLAQPGLRERVAGVSEAHRRHGGEGALYVALKRKPRPAL